MSRYTAEFLNSLFDPLRQLGFTVKLLSIEETCMPYWVVLLYEASWRNTPAVLAFDEHHKKEKCCPEMTISVIRENYATEGVCLSDLVAMGYDGVRAKLGPPAPAAIIIGEEKIVLKPNEVGEHFAEIIKRAMAAPEGPGDDPVIH